MLRTAKAVAAVLCFPTLLAAQGNTFTRVRYNGGSVSTTVNRDDWDNKLTVTSDSITLDLKDGQSIAIPPKRVTSLSYGQEAHRRVGTAVLIGVFTLGIGALSALHKTKLHYIGINYDDKDGKKQGILLQGDKGNYRAILVALQGVSGVPVSVGEKERGEIPAGMATQVAKDAEESKENPSPATKAQADESPAQAGVTVPVTSVPDGADITVDGKFVGSTPSRIKLAPGDHTVRIEKSGFSAWQRTVTVSPGSEVSLNATLERIP